MKKGLIFVAAGFLMLATSCKETLAPSGPITVDSLASESSEMLAPETPQARRVYIEEFTGVKCTNCPDGALVIEDILEKHPDQVVSLSFHAGGSVYTAPITGHSKQDFTTADGIIMEQSVWTSEIEVKPNATFDRAYLNGSKSMMQSTYTSWPGTYAADIAQYPTTPVNLHLTSTYNAAKNRYDIVAQVAFTEDVNYSTALNIYVSEDGIIDAQELSPVNIIDDYVFNHVFRKALTNAASGQIILPDMTTKQKGLVYTYKTSLVIDPTDTKQAKWNPDHMKVTACVNVNNKPTDGHVLHVVQTNLKGE